MKKIGHLKGFLKIKIGLNFSVPVSCSSNFDCIDGNTCADSMCLPRCESDQTCALNEKCIGNNCMRKLKKYLVSTKLKIIIQKI